MLMVFLYTWHDLSSQPFKASITCSTVGHRFLISADSTRPWSNISEYILLCFLWICSATFIIFRLYSGSIAYYFQHDSSNNFDVFPLFPNHSLSCFYLDCLCHRPLLSLHLLWLNVSPPGPALLHFPPHHLLHWPPHSPFAPLLLPLW